MDLHPDFCDLLGAFAAAEVEYLLIGGYAVSFHARPRATKDLDLLLGGDPANLARAAGALAEFGAPANVVRACRTLGEREVLYMGQPPVRVDLLRSIDGVELAGVFARGVAAVIGGANVRVISVPDLIANKRAANRPQDRLDVAILEQLGVASAGDAPER
jgi:hypothetical protein